MFQFVKYGFILWLFSCQVFVYADTQLAQRKDVQQFITTMVKQQGFDRRQLVGVMQAARYQPAIIESMEKPYEKKTWDSYQALFLTPARVKAGIAYWKANQAALQQAQAQFGVPIPIMVAIIGVETLYGQHQGNYRVLDALTTLAFHYPKRSEFFKKELKEYLLLCREQSVPATSYLGSYAGAIGKPQFMPSSYRSYAVDFTGNGKKDLVHDDRDVIGSVANYFHRHGWKLWQAVAQQASLKAAHHALAVNTKQATYDIKTLYRAGVRVSHYPKNVPARAGLIELTTSKGPEYWVAYPNFYVITRYNTSPQYALVVYLLAEQLRMQWAHSR